MGALVRETYRAMVERFEHEFEGTDLLLSHWLERFSVDLNR